MARLVRLTACAVVVAGALTTAACTGDGANSATTAAPDTLVIHLAASVTRPMQPVLDAFADADGRRVVIQRESGGSLDHARKITELGRIPDILLLADEEVFPQLLAPDHVRWWAAIARNRMVIAWSDRSVAAGEMSDSTWTRILTRAGIEVGRSDPEVAPAGYRALLVMQLAERHYGAPGLAARLLANAPASNMRANAADLAALVAAGELDYIYEYRSVAQAYGLRYLELPPEIDLGDPARADQYATVQVSVGSRGGRSRAVVGRPILYAISIPDRAPHPEVARRFLAHLWSPESRATLARGHFDLLDSALVFGQGAPPEMRHGR